MHSFLFDLCNQSWSRHVKRAGKMIRTVVTIACLAGFVIRPAMAAPSSLDRVETALKQIQSGDTRAAAVTLKQALDADPGETLLHNAAGALLLITGDYGGALSEWRVSLNDLPDDGLALYAAG